MAIADKKAKQESKEKKSLIWVRYAFQEGTAKATNKTLNKFFGGYIKNVFGANLISGIFFVYLVIGFIQMIGGLFLAKRKSKKLFFSLDKIRGSIVFGIVASAMSFLSIYTFTFPGADIAVATFLVTLSIIPSRLIDRFIFKESLLLRQYIGLLFYLIIAYIFLKDFMDPKALLGMPPWAWTSLGAGLLLSINNLIVRKLGKTDAFVHNFWVGLTTLIISIIIITLFKGWGLTSLVEIKFWIVFAFMGLVVLFMIFSKVLAFQAGATLTFEIFVQQSTLLILATIFGVIFFHEPFTIGKMIGIPGFFVAFILANQEMWEYVTGKIKKINIK